MLGEHENAPSNLQLDAAAANDVAPGGEGTGHFSGVNNVLGPKYGLPGYKASHNWEGQNDVDLLSPLIFDWRAYVVKYGDKTESAAKTEWIAKLKSLKYPNCRQGRYIDHPPAGFDLKLYYDQNKASMQLGPTPTCLAIAQQFLSEGIFAASPWASSNAGDQKPFNDGVDVKGKANIPASSWLLCKWRRGGGKMKGLNMWNSLNSGYKESQVYSRALRPYDMVMSKLGGAMLGFKPTREYSVSFWYRPVGRMKGELFNFGESVDYKYSRYNWRKYFSPGVKQHAYTTEGAVLSFQISTTKKRFWECKVEGATGCKGSTCAKGKTAASKVLPWGKWTFVTLTVDKNAKATVYYDNQLSAIERRVSGSTATSGGKLGAVQSCSGSGRTYLPRRRIGQTAQGYPVSSYMPIGSQGNSNEKFGDLAGLTYYNKKMPFTQLNRHYKFEEKGVKGWTMNDAKGSDNGVC